VRAGIGAPSPVGPRAGGGREEAGLHVQAELRWGSGVAWRRPRALARASTSPARSSCPGPESTCMGKSVRNNVDVKSTRVARARACSLSGISFLSLNVLYLDK
jgi:hypothetical protein